MADNNMTGNVPVEAIQQQHEAIIAAVKNASDFETETDNAISTDESISQTNVEDQKDTSALTDNEDHTDDETESSCPEWKGATWQDGTRAVLRLYGPWGLDHTTQGAVAENTENVPSFEEAVPSGTSDTREADTTSSSSFNHVYFVVQAEEGGNENVSSLQEVHAENDENAYEIQSLVSTTSESSLGSNFSGSTLVDEPQVRVAEDDEDDGDDESDSDDESYYIVYPEFDQWELLDEALLLNLLEDHGIPATQTLAFDVTWQNALQRPYSIYASLPGERLSDLERKEMLLKDRLYLAGGAAELRARLETIHFQGTGRVQVKVNENMTAGRLPLDMSARADINEHLDTRGFLVEPDNHSETGSEDTTKAILRIPRLDEPVSPGNGFAEYAIAHRVEIQATENTDNPYLWFCNAFNDNLAPESNHLEILDGVAILKLLTRFSIPIPRILAFNATQNNALRFPYSLYTRLPGVTLGDVWKDMPTDDKINIAGELATLLADLDTIRFPQSGRLLHDEITTNAQSPLDLSKRSEVGENVFVGGFCRGPNIIEGRDKPTVPTTSSLYDLFSTHLDDKIQYAKFREPEMPDFGFSKLQTMLQDMKDMNWFALDDGSAEYSIVNHNDYDPRNIIVEHRQDADGSSGWHISGIVDWDDAHCVPPVLTRRPPLWLFDFSDDDLLPETVWKYYFMDYDMMPLEYYKEINPDHLTVEGAKIKERFEQVIVDKIYTPRYGARAMEFYQDDTYGRGRWLRRVWRFANEGMFDNSHYRRLGQVLKEWDEFKETGQVSHRTVFGEEDDSRSNATDSTTAYDHEPFETFQHRVSTLGSDLDVIFDDIKHMRGGSFNRVVPVTLRNPPETASWIDRMKAIIRIPRVWDGDLTKVPADEHGRTCKCDAHPDRQVVVSGGHESESGSTSSTAEETSEDLPTVERSVGTEETDSFPNDQTPDKDSSSEDDDDDASDVGDLPSITLAPYGTARPGVDRIQTSERHRV
ncbi:unnamed protein product [Aureobasidium vineae]|uniref:Aminoglycoside phosphotransferase domain-containing protein n=1 Tax=Aureobasidium vineae TaxID=2773715 RepID=A0A9N8JIN4_9PEZI|nr:unnamed protein product [Aureobasidium vineae]